MPEDQIKAQILAAATNLNEEIAPVASEDVSVPSLVEPTHKDFKAPADLLGIMQEVETPNLSGVKGTGAITHPPLASEVSGNVVIITPPVGIIDFNAAKELLNRKAEDSQRGAAQVYVRQEERKAA